MKVSVLFPVYNSAPFLQAALDSLYAQTFTDFEILALNDGSTDNSLEILKNQTDKRLKIVNAPENMGLIANLNKGIVMAEGEYLIRMDSDDLCTPDRFEKLVAYMDKHPDVVVCSSAYRLAGEVDSVVTNPNDHDLINESLIFLPRLCHAASIMRRATFVNNGLEYPQRKIAEDYALWTILADYGQFANLPDILYTYNLHPGSSTHTMRADQAKSLNALHKDLIKKRLDFTPTQPELDLHLKLHMRQGPKSFLEWAKMLAWCFKLYKAAQGRPVLRKIIFKYFFITLVLPVYRSRLLGGFLAKARYFVLRARA